MADLVKFPARREVERTAQSADPTIQRALKLLGQALNPVRVVTPDEAGDIYGRNNAGLPSANMIGFRAPNDTTDANIYINRDSAQFQNAAQHPDDPLAQLLLSASLVHEQIHNTDDEAAARRKEADYLESRIPSLPKGQQAKARERVARINQIAQMHDQAERKALLAALGKK